MRRLVKRKCVECGVEKEVWGHGEVMKWYRSPSFWCEECLSGLPEPMVRLTDGTYATRASLRRASGL